MNSQSKGVGRKRALDDVPLVALDYRMRTVTFLDAEEFESVGGAVRLAAKEDLSRVAVVQVRRGDSISELPMFYCRDCVARAALLKYMRGIFGAGEFSYAILREDGSVHRLRFVGANENWTAFRHVSFAVLSSGTAVAISSFVGAFSGVLATFAALLVVFAVGIILVYLFSYAIS
ncbi:MAG: hypothetical protein LBB14_01145 [Puniceicoccales bacterium]|jgi:hypothetical protein|nr:hypothetical protein [Puniceicoccales bacterium]